MFKRRFYFFNLLLMQSFSLYNMNISKCYIVLLPIEVQLRILYYIFQEPYLVDDPMLTKACSIVERHEFASPCKDIKIFSSFNHTLKLKVLLYYYKNKINNTTWQGLRLINDQGFVLQKIFTSLHFLDFQNINTSYEKLFFKERLLFYKIANSYHAQIKCLNLFDGTQKTIVCTSDVIVKTFDKYSNVIMLKNTHHEITENIFLNSLNAEPPVFNPALLKTFWAAEKDQVRTYFHNLAVCKSLNNSK